jgi:hypothetical protein
MGGFSAVYGAYNVQGSINQWFARNITASGNPVWMPSARVIFDWGKDRPIISGHSGHAFTVFHLPDRQRQSFQGARVDNGSAGSIRAGAVDISCWVSREIAGEAYMARVRQMGDMVGSLWQANQTFAYANLYAATAGTASATARIVLEDIEFQPPQQDGPNPDLWRVRAIAGYSWVRRV